MLENKNMNNEGDVYMRQVEIIVEKHSDGYVAYPSGLLF